MFRHTGIRQMSMFAGTLVCTFALLTATGCDPVTASLLGLPSDIDLAPPPEALEEHVILAGTADRLLIVRTQNSAWAELWEELGDINLLRPWEMWEKFEELEAYEDMEFEPPDTEVLVVNLHTLESELLVGNVPSDSFWLMSDGRWLAWMEYAWDADEEGSIHVIHLDSGTESTYFRGLAGGRIQDIVTVSGGYLVLEAGSRPYSATSLVVINLDSGEQQAIEQAFLAGGYAGFNGQGGSVVIRDNTLLMHVWPPYEEGIDIESETPLTSTIDRVDPTTGERSTLVADAGPESDGGLYLVDDQILLLSSPWDDSTPTTVRSFSLDGGSGKILLELETPGPMTGWSYVEALNERGVVIYTSENEWTSLLNFKVHEWLEFRAFDGSVVAVAETVTEGFDIAPLELTGWLVENYVIYRDPLEYDYVVFDVETQEERRFDPFGS